MSPMALLNEIAENDSHQTLENLKGIVETLDYLRTKASQTGNEDIETLINANFDIMVTTYTMILREISLDL